MIRCVEYGDPGIAQSSENFPRSFRDLSVPLQINIPSVDISEGLILEGLSSVIGDSFV